MRDAPLFTRVFDLCKWVLERTEGIRKSHRFVVGKRLQDDALDLLDAVTLALTGMNKLDSVERADAALALLRVHLRLAVDLQLLQRRQLQHAAKNMDDIGKMIGAWQKRL